MSLVTNIEYLMQMKNITAQELSNETNIDRSTLTRILNGSTTKPRLETIHTLAKYFNVSTESLLNNQYNNEIPCSQSSINKKNLREILTWLMSKTGIVNLSMLHKYTNIPLSVLSVILSGKTEKPNVRTLQKLSNFFNLTVPQLMGNEIIPDSFQLTLNPDRKTIPIIPFINTIKYLRKELTTYDYFNVNRPTLDEAAFAIKIESDQFEPDFSQNQILVVDNYKPENGDFIIAEEDNKISIYEYKIDNFEQYIRIAGTLKWRGFNLGKTKIYGVIVQQIINIR